MIIKEKGIHKRTIVFILIGIVLVFLIGLLLFQGYHWYRIRTAKIEVTLKKDRTLEFASKKRVSDYIEKINGTIVHDDWIPSTKLGKQDVTFEFVNDDHIKVSYTYQVEIVDTVEPMIWLGKSYTVYKDSEINLTKAILCGDNYDNRPTCIIKGDYDIHTVGEYPLEYEAIDSSGNRESQSFTLRVIEKPEGKKKETSSSNDTYFEDVKKKYKKKDTKIGIDISSWQGEVDFKKIKEAGVEFVMVRIGGTLGTNQSYFLDKQFQRNMKEAEKYGIDTGVYFYSYANSTKSAVKDAKWVIQQLKPYKIKLSVAFDWEEWDHFNDYHLSFFGLTNMAETFLDTIQKAGYDGMLYSSKTYLDNIWYPTKYDVWLAHYTDKTNYQGNYKIWQLCANGKIDGIENYVDIDIMYTE
ncbi:MAG: glycoside hydrolase family 25 protein [Firmicutes bacterium]|nr:glycoside hydrolase family 25 protein [Bacillota bacterium]